MENVVSGVQGPQPVRAFDDHIKARDGIFQSVLNAVQTRFPIENQRHQLLVENPRYADDKRYSIAEQKKMILQGGTLTRKMIGDWVLKDKTTGMEVDRRKGVVLAHVPYLTERGTFISNGTEYTVANQARLRPGIYSRVKENGELEAHVNLRTGTGRGFKLYMEPSTGVFRMGVGQSTLKLYPIMRAMGVSDEEMSKAWGNELLQANMEAADARAVARAHAKLVHTRDVEEDEAVDAESTLTKESTDKIGQDIRMTLERGELDPDVTLATLGEAHDRMRPSTILRTTRKLLDIQKGAADTDDRDALAFQQFYSPEDFFAERIAKDAGQNLRKLLWKATLKGNLKHVPSGALTKQLNSVLLNSGLGSTIEEVNPMEVHDQTVRVTRLGVGGISNIDAVPDESRSVTPSQFGVIDFLKSPECYDAATSVFTSSGFKLWKDVTADDELACLIDGHLSFSRPLSLHASHYSGIMYGASGAYVDYLVTPNHRMWSRHFGRLRIGQAEGYEIQRADAMHNTNRHIMCSHKPFIGTYVPYFTLPEIRVYHTKWQHQFSPFLMEDWASFMGWYLSEGNTQKNASSVLISQSQKVNPDKFKLIELLLNKIGIRWAYTRDKVRGITGFRVCGTQLGTYTKQFGFSNDKYIPDYLFSVQVSARRNLLDALLLGDGRFSKGQVMFTTGSKQLAHDVQRLAISLGHATLLGTEKPKRKPDGSFYGMMYTVRIYATRQGITERAVLNKVINNYSNKDYNQYYTTNYSGMVYCATVPGGLLLVSRNGKPAFWCGNSSKVGIDSRFVHGLFKGPNNTVMFQVKNTRGEPTYISTADASKVAIAFPGELSSDKQKVYALVGGSKVESVPREEVHYELPHAGRMFTATSNLIPFIGSMKGGRVSMAARMVTQALPLQNSEAPLVRSESESGKSYYDEYGPKAGAIRSDVDGVVTALDGDSVTVVGLDGKPKTHDLYNNFALNRRTFWHNTPMVKIGDKVTAGSLLAKSNYTDNDGAVAIGTNLRIGYIPWKGRNYEDAIVISESAAKKLTSEHLYQHVLPVSDNTSASRKDYIAQYPSKFKSNQLQHIDDNGVIKPGAQVKFGDPLILALDKTKYDAVHRGRSPMFTDAAVTWKHYAPGEVTDVVQTSDGSWNVTVKSYARTEVGDKLTNRYGGKGIVGEIVPDDKMPQTKDGKPMEILLNPLGVISRGTPAQMMEVALGKVARKTGKPINVPHFMPGKALEFSKALLSKHGVSDTEDLVDPENGSTIPKVFTGETYIMKLHHTAEGKGKGRDTGGYTMDELPAKGGDDSSKRISNMELASLIAHGATNVIKDARLVRGQRNDDYWKLFRMGLTPPSPKVPLVYEKFLASLQGAGINLKKNPDSIHLYAMTQKDAEGITGDREIRIPETFKANDLEPIEGGLFDKQLTGGHGGDKFAKITLPEPVPNPVMEEPLRKILGLTQKKYEAIISGREDLHGQRGGAGLKRILESIDLDKAINAKETVIKSGARSKRDDAVKALGYLKSMKAAGLHPKDFMMTTVPVLPPKFRPVAKTDSMTIVSDPNYLYRDLMSSASDLKELSGAVDMEGSAEERLRVYNAFKAVTGLGDPVNAKTQEKNVKGLLKHLFGNSPKSGLFQRRVVGIPTDVVGRGVVAPDADLSMDELGIPENKAWVVYRSFVVRRLIRGGMPATDAVKAVADQKPEARRALEEEMKVRPVMLNRAPTLHKYNFMAFRPRLIKDKTVHVSPVITKGYGMDFDGDSANYHVPVSDEAVKEAYEKMLPSKNLLYTKNYGVHYLPSQEFLYGLYLGSRQPNNKTPRVFATQEAAIQAYRRGELRVDDPIIIGK